MLHIHLFGYLRLLQDGQPYRFKALPKTTSLLAYLLLQRETAVARDHLAFLLWDDVPESEARANLRRHLHDLLQALPAGETWLLRDAKTVQWNPAAPGWLDTAEFERLCQDRERLTEAVALYTGDLLQASYEDWIVPERERFQALYFSTLARLMARERERGDPYQAMNYARQLLSHDPLREDVLRDYMLLRQASGDRAGALHLYRQFKERLAEELGVGPMPETTALYEQLSGSQPPAAAARQDPSPPSPAPVALPPHNLPAQLTSFVGRQEELAQVCQLIGSPDLPARLLTITGPGGTGKTRLALEAAAWLWQNRPEQFPDGLFFVGFAAVATPDRVPTAITEALGIRSKPGQSPVEALKESLRDKRLLLVLDNFEHLLEAAPLLAGLLTAAPFLRLLVTSQATLHLYGEHEFPLPPLPLPEPGHQPPPAELLNYAAVRLFVDRYQAVQPQFRLTAENSRPVTEICRCLDGMPLALELAAGRAKLLTPAAMLAQLSQRLRFLTSQSRNLPSRHQTLRATIDWSYNLLATAEQALFAGVALFAGSFSAAAAQAIFSENLSGQNGTQISGELLPDPDFVDLLHSLIDRNMLRVLAAENGAEPRFRMLQTLREYGLERLGQMETAAAIYQRFTNYYVELAELSKAGMLSTEQFIWIRHLRQEESNLIAALERLFAGQDAGQNAVLMARMLIGLSRFWLMQGKVRELSHWLERSQLYLPTLPQAMQVALLNETGNTAQVQGDYTTAVNCHRQALTLARQEGDESLIAHTLHFLAYAAGRQGQYIEARSLFQESLVLHRRLPEISPIQLTRLLNNLAIVHKRLGEYDEAIGLLEETLALKRAIDDELGLPASLANLGNLLVLQGQTQAAAGYIREALERRQQLPDRQGMLSSLNQLASLAVTQGDFGRAATLYAAADANHQAMSISRTADGEAERQRDLDVIYGRLSPEELAAYQAAGAKLTLEEGCVLALGGAGAG